MPRQHDCDAEVHDALGPATPGLLAAGSGVVLVLLGLAVNLAPIVIVASGAVIAVLNIRHAKNRGYCPLPAKLIARHSRTRGSATTHHGSGCHPRSRCERQSEQG